jgi:DNA mismatch repair protein MutS
MAKSKKKEPTPLMQQYYKMKDQHPDALLLFRMGDFYETFGKDAITTAKILGITLTKRSNGAASDVELAGFPHHAIDNYLPKLVRSGQRVAICEQLEDPKKTKKLVKRGIIELVTPGVSYNENTLENKENNFLASVSINKKMAGLSLLDLSTGEFLTTEGDFNNIDKLLSNFRPKEILFQQGKETRFRELFGNKHYIYPLEEWCFNNDSAYDRLIQHFDTTSLKGFGVEKLPLGISSAGAIVHYLDITKHSTNAHITKLARIEENNYVWLDRFTIKNLELLYSPNEGGKTLVDILDQTHTPMGSRLIKRWITLPLKDPKAINERLNTVSHFVENGEMRDDLTDLLSQIGDLERIASKIAVYRINPREFLQLANALEATKPIKELFSNSENKELQDIAKRLHTCDSLLERINKEILPSAPIQVSKGGVIAAGVNEELDELRSISTNGKDLLLKMQQREIENTGITNLKIGFNNVFGYYIEVTKSHSSKVPAEWTRKQTLVNAERYITPELKEYEDKIMGAEEKISELEGALYNQLVTDAGEYITELQINSSLLAKTDCLLSFANVSVENDYCCPEINDSNIIDIKEGRHPVIEQQLPPDEEYISNNVYLDNDKQQIIIITGPNMAGKSALLRQTALIVIMAQTGCFVPAKEAKIGFVDKIFTRVGASDNISMGESTFMVEMNEAANILNNISERSLILFDELGRGTSTYDGISIAWSIVEFIHEQPKCKAKTLFATHYHELNEMEKSFKRIKNYNVSVREINNKVVFLRKLVRGGSNHSFGIHVAKLAGMPKSVVKRSSDILKQLEHNNNKDSIAKPVSDIAENREGFQLSFFQLDDPILTQIRDEIAGLDINNLTPMEALNKLNDIKKLSGL